MPRSSGINLLRGATNTWTGSQVFNGAVNSTAETIIGAQLIMGSTLHTTAATIPSTEIFSLCDTTGAAFQLNLPAAPNNGEVHWVKNFTAGANALTLSGNGHNIDAAATLVMASQAHTFVIYDATNGVWRIVG